MSKDNYQIALKELESKHKVIVKQFPDQITRKMFEISKKVVKKLSEEGDLHKKIYNSWKQALTKFNRYQSFSDYGYIHNRNKYL